VLKLTGRGAVLMSCAITASWAQPLPIEARFITWQPTRDEPRMFRPSLGVLDGARYVLDYEDGPVGLDVASKAVPTKGLVFTPLIEGPVGHKPTGPLEGHLIFLQGDAQQAAVAVVASRYSIIIQDAYVWHGQHWHPWLHSYGGQPGSEVFEFQFEGAGRVLALLGSASGYVLAHRGQARRGAQPRGSRPVTPCCARWASRWCRPVNSSWPAPRAIARCTARWSRSGRQGWR
jgi:hypothetical protein